MTPIQATVAPSLATVTKPLWGRWLHEGIEPGQQPSVWNPAAWDAFCAQCARWGLQGVTPKVAEGTQRWYDDAGLSMLLSTARRYHLGIVPRHDALGADIPGEAALIAHIGQGFRSIILYMGTPWVNRPQDMQQIGFEIRHSQGYIDPIFPMTYAACMDNQQFPYVQMNQWATAWIPQCLFSDWTVPGSRMRMTAEYAATSLYRDHWIPQNARCMEQSHTPLKHILPLIGLTNYVSPGEIANWLNSSMSEYGYCGFWYDRLYSAYSTTIVQAKMPWPMGAPPFQSPSVLVHATSAPPIGAAPPTPPLAILPPSIQPIEMQGTVQVPVVHTSPPQQQETDTPGSILGVALPPVSPVVTDGTVVVGQPEPPEEVLPGDATIDDWGGETIRAGDATLDMQQQAVEEPPPVDVVAPVQPSLVELEALWHWQNDQITWDPTRGICRKWMETEGLGAPIHEVVTKVVDGQTFLYQSFSSGKTLVQIGESGPVRVL